MKNGNQGMQTRLPAGRRGFTLIEVVVSVGLFALIMTLASGAYLVMIHANRQAQSITTGINNLAFALETMMRTIRTSTNYSCDGGTDCPNGEDNFSVKNSSGATITYALSDGVITQNAVALTDPSVTVSSLTFHVSGTGPVQSDREQPRVTISILGTIVSGPGRTEPFAIETGATMRGTDL